MVQVLCSSSVSECAGIQIKMQGVPLTSPLSNSQFDTEEVFNSRSQCYACSGDGSSLQCHHVNDFLQKKTIFV